MVARRVTVTYLVLSCLASILHDAHAEPTAPVRSVSECSVRGTAQMPIHSPIYDNAGRTIALFSGSDSALRITEFPPDAQGRARVETGTGTGSFRVQGFIQSANVPLFASSNLPVVNRHLWIAQGRSITFVGVSGSRMRIQKKLSTPFQQVFSAWAPCNSVTFSAMPSGWSPPGEARGYMLKKESLDVYDQAGANASIVTTLTRSPNVQSVLFFSTEQQPGWVQIEHHSDVIVRGWAKAEDLTALPRGEIMDQLMPASSSQRSAARLAFQGQPQTVRTRSEVPLRLVARDSEPAIGVIESGTETLVLDVVAGWASVLPGSLHVVPPKDRQFWVKAVELGIDSGRAPSSPR